MYLTSGNQCNPEFFESKSIRAALWWSNGNKCCSLTYYNCYYCVKSHYKCFLPSKETTRYRFSLSCSKVNSYLPTFPFLHCVIFLFHHRFKNFSMKLFLNLKKRCFSQFNYWFNQSSIHSIKFNFSLYIYLFIMLLVNSYNIQNLKATK